MNRKSILLFLLIIVISAAFRITNLDLIEFKDDEAINLFLAARPIFGHAFTPAGTISSLGILNTPLLNYLLFPFVLISTDPRVISFLIGLLNSIGIGFLFIILKRYYGTTTSFIASILIALSPWSILYSRKIWAQDFLLPFMVILLYALHKIIMEKKSEFIFLYSLVAVLLIQLYQPAIFLIFMLTLFLIINLKIKHNKLLTGTLVGLIPLIPYLFYQFGNSCPDCGSLFIATQKLSKMYDTVLFRRPFQILNEGNMLFVMGKDLGKITYSQVFILLRKSYFIEYVLLALGSFLFWKNFKNMRFILYTTLTIPFLYFLLHITPHMHYFTFLIPFLFLFVGMGISHLLNYKNKYIRIFGFATLISILVSYIYFDLSFFRILAQNKGLDGDYGKSYIVVEKDREKLFKKYNNSNEYQEMIIASYIPKSFIHGDAPGGKMLYSKAPSPDRIAYLENRLKDVPEDTRVHNELISLYTKTPVNNGTLKILENKQKKIPGYKYIYEDIYNSLPDSIKHLNR